MAEEIIKKMLEAGVHFGHQTKRWNPKMRKFIFGERSGIYIIDLEKTVELLNKARDFVYSVAAKGGNILFVGTKKQAQEVVKEAAQQTNMFFVSNRWLGGLLTNFQTVKKSVERLKAIERMAENGTFEKFTKKEVARLTKEKDKLLKDLGGIRSMGGLPAAVFIIDAKKEDICVKESVRLKIPIVGLIDTNCDPDFIDFPIPGNDDALKSIRLITTMITESILEGRRQYMTSASVEPKAKEEPLPPVTAPVVPAAVPLVIDPLAPVVVEDLEVYEETIAPVVVTDESRRRAPKVKPIRDKE